MHIKAISLCILLSSFQAHAGAWELLGGAPGLQAALATSSCSTLRAANFCRALPWVPHMKEGAWEVGQTGLVVFSRAGVPKDFLKQTDRYEKAAAPRLTALHLLLGTSFSDTAIGGVFASVGVMEVEYQMGGMVPLWLYIAPSMGLQHFRTSYDHMKAGWNETDTEWTIPDKVELPGELTIF